MIVFLFAGIFFTSLNLPDAPASLEPYLIPSKLRFPAFYRKKLFYSMSIIVRDNGSCLRAPCLSAVWNSVAFQV